jgi:hypothetical protein
VDGAMHRIQFKTHFLNSASPLRELAEIESTIMPDWRCVIAGLD